MPFTKFDSNMMHRALLLARAGAGCVSPNPLVGCVIVNANGEVIGEGAHLIYGGPHAEPNAIRDAEAKGHSVRGATTYVTLEPHSHQGKTPPCSKLLIEKGIARCVVAMEDPNPNVSGAGIRDMRDAGIEVEVGLLEAEARELNKFFIKHVTTGFPYVTLKLASTLDGRNALANGESKWITSEASRAIVHQMRAEYDAVLIGTRTALLDDPALTVRLVQGRQPKRIILDARLELLPTLTLFTDEYRSQTILITSPRSFESSRRKDLAAMGIEIMAVKGIGERIDLKLMLRQLGERNITSVLVEPGPTLAASFIEQNLFDELDIFYAPLIFGNDAQPSVGTLTPLLIPNSPQLSLQSAERVKGSVDILLRFKNVNVPN